jgi:two-component system response regulator HydG
MMDPRRPAHVDRSRAVDTRPRPDSAGAPELVGSSPALREVKRMIEAVADSAATVLVTGESGTGKELVARALHDLSPRRDRPFVAVNCGALPETLLESELFGHVKGAFTGAERNHTGLFAAAHGGTILLDEIGDVPPSVQVRLLRVLQEGELKRVGCAQPVKVDVRVVAATNRDLPRLVKAGKFRGDLLYRLNVIQISVPPLRKRIEDVPLLAYHFLRRQADRHGKRVRSIAPEALELLAAHSWPGNVRELENSIERAIVLSRGDVLVASDLPASVSGDGPVLGAPSRGRMGDLGNLSYRTAKALVLDRFESEYLDAVMTACGRNVSAAARRAGMQPPNFRRVLRRHRSRRDSR